MPKNKILASIAFLTLIAGAIAPITNAQTESSSAQNQQMSIQIGAKGNIKLTGTIASISGTTLNVASWGGTWVVNAANAKLTRRSGGASNLSEFQNGDLLAISGTVAQSGWAVTAGTIKNNSIQTKNASFSGTISNFNASNQTFTLQTTSRGNVAISVNASTTILLRGKQVNFSDLASSTRATVSGIWDRNQSAFMASKIIGKITASDSNSTSTSH